MLERRRDGFYVEIGGYDPKRLSNTYRFCKRGFRGVVIEPNPDCQKKDLKELGQKIRL